jgi:hypothetical protein
MTARQPFLTFDRVRMNVFNGSAHDDAHADLNVRS